jgi:DNA repair protein RadA/Sms
MAVASASKGVALGGERPLACFGEVGLTGELRTVAHRDRRLSEAEKFGLAPVVEPGVCGSVREVLQRTFARVGGEARAA